MDVVRAEAFAREWIEAWNRRDVEAIVSPYADDVEFQSPLVVAPLHEPSGIVRGKERLREFVAKRLAAFPAALEIELLGAYRGVASLVVHFEAKGRRTLEVMGFDHTGRIHRVLPHADTRTRA